jgi:glucan biosynthesis protein
LLLYQLSPNTFNFHNEFDQQVDFLPPSLIHLTFGKKFDQPVDNLPQNLTHLTFGNLPRHLNSKNSHVVFNQPVDHLPQNLKHLHFGSHFDHPVDYLPSISLLECASITQ